MRFCKLTLLVFFAFGLAACDSSPGHGSDNGGGGGGGSGGGGGGGGTGGGGGGGSQNPAPDMGGSGTVSWDDGEFSASIADHVAQGRAQMSKVQGGPEDGRPAYLAMGSGNILGGQTDESTRTILCKQSDGSFKRGRCSFQVQAVSKLPSFTNVDLSQTTVSGVSAGGYMAQQFQMAWSSQIKGVGVIAGGPYYCAQNSWMTADPGCMSPSSPIDLGPLITEATNQASSGGIDKLTNLKTARVYMFSGKLDQTVKQVVMDKLRDFYVDPKIGVDQSNIKYVNTKNYGHCQPVLGFGNPQTRISHDAWMCYGVEDGDYDAASDMLTHFYGDLKPRAKKLTGKVLEFDQSEFFPNNDPVSVSMNRKGYAYVPDSCAMGATCKVHVVFHGCEQVYDMYPENHRGVDGAARENNLIEGLDVYGLQMIEFSGYNEMANDNNIIVLYPQATKTGILQEYSPYTFCDKECGLQNNKASPQNPRGCFDWWGYNSGNNYHTKNGVQMKGVWNMVQRLAKQF